MRKGRKGQSIVEYLLVFGGIVLAVLIGARMIAERSRDNMNTAGDVVTESRDQVREKLGLEAAAEPVEP